MEGECDIYWIEPAKQETYTSACDIWGRFLGLGGLQPEEGFPQTRSLEMKASQGQVPLDDSNAAFQRWLRERWKG